MAYTKVGPFVDGGPPYLSAGDLNVIEAGIVAANSHTLSGPGIDPTGATVSTAAVQAFFNAVTDGSTITVPNGAIINLDATITVARRIRLTGGGELRWTAGIANAQMFDVTAAGCHFDGVYLTNPNHLAAQTGNRTAGIHFQASSGRVSNCRIVGQQQAINVEASGEWHDFTFVGNLILDVPGSGDGASSGTGNGEDRGDGITVWGATATIVGNRVDLLAGSDGRVGIHVEALAGSIVTPYVHSDSMCTITGNVVTGKFRRGITSEGVAFTTISGNTVADATWWGINLSNTAHNCVVQGNTINWTRTAGDNQGSAFSPSRAGIMAYDQVQNAVIANNIITVANGAVMTHGICLQASDASHLSQNAMIVGNRITDPNYGISNGIQVPNGATAPSIINNSIDGFKTYGISAGSSTALTIRGNTLIGSSSVSPAATGINSTGTTGWARCDANTITNVGTAIALYQRGTFTTVIGNVVTNASTGVDLFQTTGKATVSDNTFVTVTTSTQNLPTGAVASGNN